MIEVKNLGKAYPVIYNRRQALEVWLGLKGARYNWVLRNVNFKIAQGETVGLLGVNGAGKSTTLKLITGTSIPTEGTIRTEGKIAALLELGMGFHYELTGRQNVFLQGYMQELTKQQIEELIPSIEAFADIGDYFNQPLRTYSSGMFVRLAFSVATAVRPDILIVDEALAVGDTYFKHKSFARIRQYRDEGATLLFVSHDAGAVKSICDRTILLGKGGVLMDGKPHEVLEVYNAMIADKSAEFEPTFEKEASATQKEAEFLSVKMLSRGNPTSLLDTGEPLTLEVRFRVNKPLPDLTVGFEIQNRLGEEMFGADSASRNELLNIGVQTGEKVVEFRLPALNLGQGRYAIVLFLQSRESQWNFDRWERAAFVEVVPQTNALPFIGACRLDLDIVEMNKQ